MLDYFLAECVEPPGVLFINVVSRKPSRLHRESKLWFQVVESYKPLMMTVTIDFCLQLKSYYLYDLIDGIKCFLQFILQYRKL